MHEYAHLTVCNLVVKSIRVAHVISGTRKRPLNAFRIKVKPKTALRFWISRENLTVSKIRNLIVTSGYGGIHKNPYNEKYITIKKLCNTEILWVIYEAVIKYGLI